LLKETTGDFYDYDTLPHAKYINRVGLLAPTTELHKHLTDVYSFIK